MPTNESSPSLPNRLLVFAYGVAAYVMFLGVFVYAIGFIAGFLVPTSLDGESSFPFLPALAIDLALLAVFAVQHSVMARPAFKRWWTRIVPPAAERSTYVLFSNLAMIALFLFWQPLGGSVWSLEHPTARAAVWALYGAGWGIVLVATFLIDHFDLFGLRQVFLYLRGRPYTPPAFRVPHAYRYVRHPLYVGWILLFWAAPDMTTARLVFALTTTAYILVAVRFEERDLVAEHGPSYAEYRDKVPMIVPALRPRVESRPADSTVD